MPDYFFLVADEPHSRKGDFEEFSFASICRSIVRLCCDFIS